MATSEGKRRLAAILAADVVGYSRMMAADEAATLAALKSRRREILDPLLAKHSGRLFKLVGDGALVEFSSAVNAVQCAVALQEAFAAANSGIADEKRIVLRIGVHLGDVMVEGSDLYGDGVNIAARLEGLAEPSGVLISEDVQRQVGNKIGIRFEDIGPQRLKNIAQSVRAFRIAGATAAGMSRVHLERPEDAIAIAVLPFDNMSGVPEQDYIGHGIAENILTDLSRFRDLTVIARNSSFAYKGKPTRIQDIRRDLGVNYVLEGSVFKAGDRIRVTAQLIEGATGKHLWAERYDRRADDLFAIMDEITELIVGTLASTSGGRLRQAASEKTADSAPTSFRAFDHFVRGLREGQKQTKESLALAIVHFEEAIAAHRRYAKAYAQLAWSHLISLSLGWSSDESDTRRKAWEAANGALAADDAEGWAHWAAAGCAMIDGQHDRALSGMRRAIELNPSDTDILADMGLFCAHAGKAEEGLTYALRAMSMNPHHPEIFSDQLGEIYFYARQPANAIRTLESLRTVCTPNTLLHLAASYAALGNVNDAHGAITRLLQREPQSTINYWLNLMPFRTKSDLEYLASNLRVAGLTE